MKYKAEQTMIAENTERGSLGRRSTRRSNPLPKKEEIYDSDDDGGADSNPRTSRPSERETRSKATPAVKIEHNVSFGGGEPMEEEVPAFGGKSLQPYTFGAQNSSSMPTKLEEPSTEPNFQLNLNTSGAGQESTETATFPEYYRAESASQKMNKKLRTVKMTGAEEVEEDEPAVKQEELSVLPVLDYDNLFKKKVNMPLSDFNWQLQKKKQNFLVNAQVNSIIKKEQEQMRQYLSNFKHPRESAPKETRTVGVNVRMEEERPPIVQVQRAQPAFNQTQQSRASVVQELTGSGATRYREKPKMETHCFKQRVQERRTPRLTDDESILAEIRSVNLYCQEQDRIYKSSKMEEQARIAQEREQSEAKRDNVSSVAGERSVKEETDAQSLRRRQESLRSSSLYYSRHPHHKNKRLEIVNRYHYNPFEETDGDDQVGLWKQLMFVEMTKYHKTINDKGESPFREEDMEDFLKGFSKLNEMKGHDMRQITDAHFKVHSTYVPRAEPREPIEEDEEEEENDEVGMYLDLGGVDTKEENQSNMDTISRAPSKSLAESQVVKQEVKAENDPYGLASQSEEEQEQQTKAPHIPTPIFPHRR